MRIGTWNVENRLITEEHRDLLLAQNCDVWLLTELNRKWMDSEGKIFDFHCHLSAGIQGRLKGSNQVLAAVLCLQAFDRLLPDPHPASAAAIINGITYCSTILPWRSAKGVPWVGSNHSERTLGAITSLLKQLPTHNLVWGGDWNHSLIGKEHAGSMAGRKHVLQAVKKLGLNVPTTDLLHRGDYCNAFDHIAVPTNWKVTDAKRICAKSAKGAKDLSDHDAYVIEVREQ
jgi:hypothetical protein